MRKIASEKTTVVDAIRERRAPFSPEQCVDEFVEVLQIYKITAVVGDRDGSAWVSERFRIHGIKHDSPEKPKSDLYKECLPAINSGKLIFWMAPAHAGAICFLGEAHGARRPR